MCTKCGPFRVRLTRKLVTVIVGHFSLKESTDWQCLCSFMPFIGLIWRNDYQNNHHDLDSPVKSLLACIKYYFMSCFCHVHVFLFFLSSKTCVLDSCILPIIGEKKIVYFCYFENHTFRDCVYSLLIFMDNWFVYKH